MKFISLLLFVFLSSCVVSQKKIRQSDDHHKIAVGFVKQCDYPRALSHVLKAVKLDPGNFITRHTLATIYYFMGHHKKALTEWRKVLRQKPNFTEGRVSLARIHLDLNQPDQSLRELKTAETDMTYTDYLKIVSQKGLAHYKKKNYSVSKKWLEEALSLPRGKNCFVYMNLGRAEMALGNFEKSEEHLKQALSVCPKERLICANPSHEEHLALAELYIKKKENKRARYHLNLFLKKSKEKDNIKKAKRLIKRIS